MKMLAFLMAVHAIFASTPHIVWNQTFDFGADDFIKDLVIDPSGNLCAGGYTVGQDGMGNFCLVKYSSDGVILRDTTYDAGADDRAEGLGVDASGNIFLAGTCIDGLQQDYYIVKYDAEGNLVWNRPYDLHYDRAYGAAADASGNVYVTGVTVDGGGDCLTVKFTGGGDFVWEKTYGPSPNDQGSDVTVDSEGNVHVVGRIQDGEKHNCHIISYDSGGNEILNIDHDFGLNDLIYGITTDGSGNIYVTGHTKSTQENRLVTAKFAPPSTLEWEVSRDAGSFDVADAVAVDASGNVYVAGTAGGNFVTIKYDAQGNEVWCEEFDGGGQDQASGIAIDEQGFVYVAGTSQVEGSPDFRVIKYEEVEAVSEDSGESGSLHLTVSNTPSTCPRISCLLPGGTEGEVALFSPDGCRIRIFKVLSSSTLVWDGSDDEGSAVSPGVYLVVLSCSSKKTTAKAILLR